MLTRLLVLVAALTLVAPSPVAISQRNMSQWRVMAKSQIQQIWQRLKAEQGFGYAGEATFGALEQEDDEYFEFEFVAHRDYVIVGVCDNDCDDLDLLLYDRNDNVVAQDTEIDDYPTLALPAGRSGLHYVEAAMASCDVDPCFYAVQVFHRYAGSPNE